jgi:hypothetical protein
MFWSRVTKAIMPEFHRCLVVLASMNECILVTWIPGGCIGSVSLEVGPAWCLL